jgi:outer membrane protein TolC
VTTQGISAPTTSVREAWSAGIAQNVWKGGGNYTLNWTNSRFNSPSSVNIRNPQFQSGLVANYTQPLWRGFKIDATRASLQTTRIAQKNDQISLTSTAASTQANVRNAYWDLVYAIEAVGAAQNSFDLANRLIQDNQARVEIGTLAPIDVVSAQAEAAARRNTLVTAQATVRTAELALKRLIVSGTDDPLWTSSINPVDRPPTAPEPINLEAAVARRAQSAHRPATVEKQSADQRHQSPGSGRRDEAAAEPDRELRLERPRWTVPAAHRRGGIR